MNIRKKGAAIGFTATLLAAMIAVVAAPLASAAVTVTSAGAVPRGGTSTNAATFTFTENSAACFNAAGNAPALTVTINDVNGGDVTFTGLTAPVAPGSLGATASASGNVITINFAGASNANVEQVSVSAKITAATTATPGAIVATLAGPEAACVLATTATASGGLAFPYPAGTTAITVILSSTCVFAVTGGLNGNATVGAETPLAVAAVGAPVGNVQSVTLAAPGLSQAELANTLITQTVANCSVGIASPGTVTNALTQTTGAPAAVNIGENNQTAQSSTWSEAPSGVGSEFAGTLTFAISTPAAGVVFSNPPTVAPTGGVNLGAGLGVAVPCTLSIDRKSCTVTVVSNTAATLDSVTLTAIKLDVDATVPAGTAVNVTLTQSPAVAIIVVSSKIANVGRVIVAIAAQPSIFIGFNDQPSGLKTLTEAGPAFFHGGVGSNNSFGLCLVTGETFTRAPWAVVTVGDLKLLSGVVGATQVKGTLYNAGKCAQWDIYTASTVASTIEIRGSTDDTNPLPTGANNGPRLSVPNGLAPGSTQDALLVGDHFDIFNGGAGCSTVAGCTANPAFSSFLSQAIRAFKNNVTVTAASQPNCPPGTIDCLLGNIVITETQNGQLKATDIVRGYFVPSATSLRNDVIIRAGNTNDLPIITTNSASGLLVSPVIVLCPPAIPLLNICFFAFAINQQSFGPALGQITISNIHATIANGAQTGPIQMDWGNTGLVLGIPAGAPVGQPFEAVVSNGNIGSGPNPPATTKTSATSAIGKTVAPTAFTVSTKVVTLVANSNNIVTIRIKVDPALIGKTVSIQRATKNSAGVWSSFVNLTTRTIGADGYAYYYASQHSALWASYRGSWPGNAQWAPSHSQAVQVRWK